VWFKIKLRSVAIRGNVKIVLSPAESVHGFISCASPSARYGFACRSYVLIEGAQHLGVYLKLHIRGAVFTSNESRLTIASAQLLMMAKGWPGRPGSWILHAA